MSYLYSNTHEHLNEDVSFLDSRNDVVNFFCLLGYDAASWVFGSLLPVPLVLRHLFTLQLWDVRHIR